MERLIFSVPVCTFYLWSILVFGFVSKVSANAEGACWGKLNNLYSFLCFCDNFCICSFNLGVSGTCNIICFRMLYGKFNLYQRNLSSIRSVDKLSIGKHEKEACELILIPSYSNRDIISPSFFNSQPSCISVL